MRRRVNIYPRKSLSVALDAHLCYPDLVLSVGIWKLDPSTPIDESHVASAKDI